MMMMMILFLETKNNKSRFLCLCPIRRPRRPPRTPPRTGRQAPAFGAEIGDGNRGDGNIMWKHRPPAYRLPFTAKRPHPGINEVIDRPRRRLAAFLRQGVVFLGLE